MTDKHEAPHVNDDADVTEDEAPFPDKSDTFNWLDHIEQMVASKQMVPCDRCDGGGAVSSDSKFADSDIMTCPACKGDGWVRRFVD